MKIILTITLLSLTLSMLGCQQTASNPDTDANPASHSTNQLVEVKSTDSIEEQDMPVSMRITVSGRIEYKTFEGGFYAFIADDGRHFTPQGLAPEYRRHGLIMTLTGTPMPDIATTTQFGVVFKVESVSEVDDSKVKTKPPVSVDPSEI